MAVIDIAGMRDALADSSRVIWTFCSLPTETAVVEAISRALTAEAGDDFAVLYTPDTASWALGAMFRSWFSRQAIRPRLQTEVAATGPELPPTTKAVLVLGPPEQSAAIVRSLPRAVRIFGGPDAARRAFVVAAGDRASGVRVPVLVDSSPMLPDYTAVQAYDAVTLLAAAVRRAGLSRRAIRDAIEQLSPWKGIGGELRWDGTGRNSRPVRIGVIANGRVQ
jgi:hypothetical protein